MKQYPSRLKFKKNHKVSSSFFKLHDEKRFFAMNGLFVLKSIESGKLTLKQIEAGRKAIRRNVRKAGSLWIRVFTYSSVTKKPVATRMGKGKGNHSVWICPIKAGQVIFEVVGVAPWICVKALRQASFKMPFRTKICKLIY